MGRRGYTAGWWVHVSVSADSDVKLAGKVVFRTISLGGYSYGSVRAATAKNTMASGSSFPSVSASYITSG